MPRSKGRVIVAWIAVLTVPLLIGLAMTGRVPLLARAFDEVASMVTAPSSSAADGGEAGAPTGDAAVHRQTSPLSSAQLGAPLVNGHFVTACGAPDDMKVAVNVTVKMGHAVDVNVKTDPPSPDVAACVAKGVRDLRWDVSPRTDHVTARY
jgi:hypothetical protein